MNWLSRLFRKVTRKPSKGTTSEAGIALIKEFEGLRLKSYKDPVGIWTIGYGHTKTARASMVISKQQADAMLKKDLEYYEKAVNSQTAVDLTQNEFDALVSFTYNLGPTAYSRSTLRKKLNKGDKKGAAEEFLKWTRAGGKVLKGLVRRREKERELFLGLIS